MEFTEKVNQLLERYEKMINKAINLFVLNFGVNNPIKKWRNEIIEKSGFLDSEKKILYGLHGAGCTVEFENGEIISFDFDKHDKVVIDKYKFSQFVDSTNEEIEIKEHIENLFNNNNWNIESSFIINQNV